MFIKIYLIIFIIKIFHSYIILPIDILPIENYKLQYDINSPKYIINNEYRQLFFTELEMANPTQKIPLLLKTEASYFIITSINSKENCTSYQYRDNFNFSESFLTKNNYTFYNEKKSDSYILNNCDYPKVYQAEEYCNSNETFLIHNNINLKNKIKGEKIYFELMRNVEDNITGEIGLNLYDRNKWSFNSFINILKTRNIIENYNWFFDYGSPEGDTWKGKVVLGSLPHQIYPEYYSYDDLKYAQVEAQSFLIYWRMKFDKIYIKPNDNIYFNDTMIEFKFDSNVIIGTKEYEDYILKLLFVNYFNEGKCFNDTILDYKLYSNKLQFFYCKNDGKIRKELNSLLPNIYFYSNELNYTFELKNEDLFFINNDNVYYRVLFGSQNNKIWYLGKPFSLKHKFIFNPETKKIGFYDKYYGQKEKETSNKNENKYNFNIALKIGIIIVLGILLFYLGVILGKMIYGIKRNQRANELNEDYDYIIDENKNKNNKEEFDINN